MHNQQLDQDDLSATELEQLDRRIVCALEAGPMPRIPADFAARVTSQLPAQRPASLTPTHYGQKAMLIGIVVTMAALLFLALHATGHTAFILLESLLLAQFVALAVWFSVWRKSLR